MRQEVNLGECTGKQWNAIYEAFGGCIRMVKEHVGDNVYNMYYLDMLNGSVLKWTGTDLYAIQYN